VNSWAGHLETGGRPVALDLRCGVRSCGPAESRKGSPMKKFLIILILAAIGVAVVKKVRAEA
jgi:hypothetical protein